MSSVFPTQVHIGPGVSLCRQGRAHSILACIDPFDFRLTVFTPSTFYAVNPRV